MVVVSKPCVSLRCVHMCNVKSILSGLLHPVTLSMNIEIVLGGLVHVYSLLVCYEAAMVVVVRRR
jgi:hypothetical protein